MGSSRKLTAAIFSLSLLLAACATTAPPIPMTWDGLVYRPTGESGALYISPQLQIAGYRSVMLDPPVISTDRRWHPTRILTTGAPVGWHQPTKLDLQVIQDALGAEFRRVFEATLERGGYSIVDRPGIDALRITPALVNVGPDAMTLVMDLSDASTGRLLARIVDWRREKLGDLEFPNTIVNSRNYRGAVRNWAQRVQALLEGQLENVR